MTVWIQWVVQSEFLSNFKKGISWKKKERLKTYNQRKDKRKERKGRATPQRTNRKHITLVGFGLRWCQGRTDSITNSVGFLAKTLPLCSSCHFFGWKYIGWLGQSENVSPGIDEKFLRRSYMHARATCASGKHVETFTQHYNKKPLEI